MNKQSSYCEYLIAESGRGHKEILFWTINENAKLKNKVEKLERENEEMREFLIKTILGD